MKLAIITAAMLSLSASAFAQLFPAPGSHNSTQIGPYPYHYGQGWSGQTTQIGPYGYTNYTTPDGQTHTCNSTRLGQFTSTNCN